MDDRKVRQAFALDNSNRVVSIFDVMRGKACECRCPSCKQPLVARQGEVRAWHFAHAVDTECIHGAESAIHMAAKQLLLKHKRVLVPATRVRAEHRLPDGRHGRAEIAQTDLVWTLESPQTEVVFGPIRADVAATVEDHPVIIEIAVTHPVDPGKWQVLEELGLPAIEIALELNPEGGWTWQQLSYAVLKQPENRIWLVNPGQAILQSQAEREAATNAQSLPVPGRIERKVVAFNLNGVRVSLADFGHFLTVRNGFSAQVNQTVKGMARLYGGRYRPTYKNWSFASGVKGNLIAHLEQLGAERVGEAM